MYNYICDDTLVNNAIYVAENDLSFAKIDIGLNTVTTESFTALGLLFPSIPVVTDDGTIYFMILDLSGSSPVRLCRFRFGSGLELLGDSPFAVSMISSGNDVYAFNGTAAYVMQGEVFVPLSATGIPPGLKDFFVSADEHVYIIADDHRIYRTQRALSYPNFIRGSVYHDANADCSLNASDEGLVNWKITIEGENYLNVRPTNGDGEYSFSVPEGDYTVTAQPINALWDLCLDTYNITVQGDTGTTVEQNFLAKGLAKCAGLEIDFSAPLLRRCFDNVYTIRVRNTGPEASAGTTLRLTLDPFFEFIDATIPYVQESIDVLRFNLGVLEVNDEVIFRVRFKISCDATLGTEHCMSGVLSDENECINDRSTYVECQENIGSYDPNDKRIFNEDGRQAETVDKDEYIYYHIRFQNTGTDTAFNVRVTDPLSETLDLSTLEMLSASHPYTFEILNGPQLVVKFNNILLPDSTTNEPGSHGFFKFRIKPLPSHDYGTTIPNKAGIVFDYNEAVLTNEAILVIQQSVGVKEAQALISFSLFPNPATDKITLQIPEDALPRISHYEIIDNQGRLITRAVLDSQTIPVGHLLQGIYHLVLKSGNDVVGVEEFIKN